ncbi:hypothetical protein [Leptospira meyeri]|uniref:hypothetical protein n=1 Tax=Leptospira meyeri TaxID=29508 RepID=UPI0002BE5C52|nr:hypothetical protein [Leptospira meyeri]EMJ87589.1 hypothetical protein LEP1GSC196_0673 [Leptospira meyeri serovar Semaranga str. Veldrot Semarang 173]
MSRLLLILFILFFWVSIFAETKQKSICLSLVDCEKQADSTEIHRKKIIFLTFGISEYASTASSRDLVPLYLKRLKSTILEANGETGYKGEIVLKVTHKPEYKIAQLNKAEDDVRFLESNQKSLSKEEFDELEKLKVLLGDSK